MSGVGFVSTGQSFKCHFWGRSYCLMSGFVWMLPSSNCKSGGDAILPFFHTTCIATYILTSIVLSLVPFHPSFWRPLAFFFSYFCIKSVRLWTTLIIHIIYQCCMTWNKRNNLPKLWLLDMKWWTTRHLLDYQQFIKGNGVRFATAYGVLLWLCFKTK